MPGNNTLRGYLICCLALASLVVAPGITNQTRQDKPTSGNPPTANQTDTTDTSCIFDFNQDEVPDCLRQGPTGTLFVAPLVLKKLDFDSYGLAPLLSRKERWIYVNRKGLVVVKGVPTMDNGPDSFHDGLVRVVRNNKYGFANRRGHLVIPAVYDGAMNFEKGKARVCKGCEDKCADASHDACEHHFFAGGEWFEVDTKGTAVAIRSGH
jgi:hypothetical protein